MTWCLGLSIDINIFANLLNLYSINEILLPLSPKNREPQNMNANKILDAQLIESGRDIPLQELLFAKRVLENYILIANDDGPQELLAEIRQAVRGVEYFRTHDNPCQARNVISSMFASIDNADSFESYKVLASSPVTALQELIDDRAQLIKHERGLLLAAGFDFSKI